MPNATIAQYPIEHPDLLVSNILARLEMKSIVVEHRPDLGKTRLSADDLCAVRGDRAANEIDHVVRRASQDSDVSFYFDPLQMTIGAVIEFDDANAPDRRVDEMLERFDLAVAQGAPELHSVRAA
jgi:hypothetical protein